MIITPRDALSGEGSLVVLTQCRERRMQTPRKVPCLLVAVSLS